MLLFAPSIRTIHLLSYRCKPLNDCACSHALKRPIRFKRLYILQQSTTFVVRIYQRYAYSVFSSLALQSSFLYRLISANDGSQNWRHVHSTALTSREEPYLLFSTYTETEVARTAAKLKKQSTLSSFWSLCSLQKVWDCHCLLRTSTEIHSSVHDDIYCVQFVNCRKAYTVSVLAAWLLKQNSSNLLATQSTYYWSCLPKFYMKILFLSCLARILHLQLHA